MGVVGSIIFILINVVIIYLNKKADKEHKARMQFLVSRMPKRSCGGGYGMTSDSCGYDFASDPSNCYYEVAPDGNCELFDGYGDLIA